MPIVLRRRFLNSPSERGIDGTPHKKAATSIPSEVQSPMQKGSKDCLSDIVARSGGIPKHFTVCSPTLRQCESGSALFNTRGLSLEVGIVGKCIGVRDNFTARRFLALCIHYFPLA